ncbi:MAG: hypothetical protein JWO72_2147 [Caulobacteraceae bacterium]|jgi:uncharacterized protein (TIGR01244 family)|nr:hypothetical protein [Caulobacteraceae bacterium]
MTDFRKVTDEFSVAPQIEPGDIAQAAKQGFVLVINNRPDDEQPGQPSSAQMEAEARKAGIEYAHVPVRGMPTQDQIDQVQTLVERAPGPALAFCRSGTRSIVTWSLGQSQAGLRSPQALIQLGQDAGYDLSQVLG